MVIRTVEEVQRYDPPVQFRTRTTLSDINIAGVTIPKGATVVLLFGSGIRDPARFSDSDRFDPDRTDNEHFGFGRSIHYCVGAPLARMETHIALNGLSVGSSTHAWSPTRHPIVSSRPCAARGTLKSPSITLATDSTRETGSH